MRCTPLAAALAVAFLATCGPGENAIDGANDDLTTFSDVATLAAEGASNPTVAVDPRDGTVYVAWVGAADSAGLWNVYLARRGPGEDAFGPRVRVNDRVGDAAPHEQAPAQVVVGPEGNVYVAWQNNTAVQGRRFPASDLRFARSTDGGRSFEPAIYVNDDAGGAPTSHTFHDVAALADGTVIVSWIDGRTGGSEIRFARSSDAGRRFGESRVIDAGACPCCRTALATLPDGRAFVAWRKVFDGDVRDVVVEPLRAAADDPARVHDDGWVINACPHAGPGIAVGLDGALHVAWYTGAEAGAGLFAATAPPRSLSFGPPRAIAAKGFVPTSQIKLAADPETGVWAAWEDRSSDEPRIRVGRIGSAAAAPAAPARGRSSAAGTAPAIAAGGGVIAVAWLDGEAARAVILHPDP